MTPEAPMAKPTLQLIYPRMAVLGTEPATCRYCGEEITECGFECGYKCWIHTSGKRRGSHKCGKLKREKDTFSYISDHSAEPGPPNLSP